MAVAIRSAKRHLLRLKKTIINLTKIVLLIVATVLVTLQIAPYFTPLSTGSSGEFSLPVRLQKAGDGLARGSRPPVQPCVRLSREVENESIPRVDERNNNACNVTLRDTGGAMKNLNNNTSRGKEKINKSLNNRKVQGNEDETMQLSVKRSNEKNVGVEINKIKGIFKTEIHPDEDSGSIRSEVPKKYGISRQRTGLFDHKFLIRAKDVCKNITKPFLVITVLSEHLHIKLRQTIRETWGSIATSGKWKNITVSQRVRLVFLFGTGKKFEHDEIIRNESRVFGDIVQADFIDSYFNLTHKSVMGIRWVSAYCKHAKFILKADEDVFVHVYNLINYLKVRYVPTKGMMFGHAQINSPVLRTGKWAVSNESYPFPKYPPYACGNTYVISGNIARRVFNVSGYLPFLNIEDAFVTGIVRARIGASIVNHVGFTHWHQQAPKKCEFQNSVRISATRVHLRLQYWLWDAIGTDLKDCFNSSTARGSNIHPIPHSSGFLDAKGNELVESVKDEHVYFNKSNNGWYVKH